MSAESPVQPADRYRRRPEIVTREIAGETLLVPIAGRLADLADIYCLNPTAAHVWARLDGETTLAEIRDAITETFEVDAPEAWADLADLVAELAEAGLAEAAR